MATKLQHGDSLYQVIEKVNSLLDGTVKPGSAGPSGGNNTSAASLVANEQQRATDAEQYLQNQIDILAERLGVDEEGEVVENTSGDGSETSDLQSALIMESLAAATAETINSRNISAEVARAQAAEQTLQTNINNEATRATTAEQNLQDQIDAIDISGLQQDIDDEVTRAQAAEQSLQNQINNITAAIDGTKQTDRFSSTVAGATGVYVDCYRRYGVVTIVVGGAIIPSQIAQNTTVTVTTIAAKYRPPTPMYLSFTGIMGGEVAGCNAQGTTDVAFGIRVIINTDGTVTIWHKMSGYMGWLSPNKCVTFPAWD